MVDGWLRLQHTGAAKSPEGRILQARERVKRRLPEHTPPRRLSACCATVSLPVDAATLTLRLPAMCAVRLQALPSGEYVVSRKKEGSKGAAPAAGQGGSDQAGEEGDEAGE